jgi:hypothetical protein
MRREGCCARAALGQRYVFRPSSPFQLTASYRRILFLIRALARETHKGLVGNVLKDYANLP